MAASPTKMSRNQKYVAVAAPARSAGTLWMAKVWKAGLKAPKPRPRIAAAMRSVTSRCYLAEDNEAGHKDDEARVHNGAGSHSVKDIADDRTAEDDDQCEDREEKSCAVRQM